MRNGILRVLAALATLAVSTAGLATLLISSGSLPDRTADCMLKGSVQISQQVIDEEANCLTNSAIMGHTPLEAAETIRSILLAPETNVQGCHLLGHAVGRAMYRLLGDGAIIPSQSWCEDSYYHGMMAEQVRESAESASSLTTRVCRILTAPDALRPLDPEQCRSTVAHGTGHAVYANTNSTAESFTICDSLESNQREQCAYGAVMEQSIQSGSNPNQVNLALADDCAALLDTETSAGCYSGVAELAVDQGQSLTDLCARAQGWALQRCEYSFGSYLTLGLSNTAKLQYAEQNSQCSLSQDCARGLGAMRFLWLRDAASAVTFCNQILRDAATLQYCLKGVELASIGKSGLERDWH